MNTIYSTDDAIFGADTQTVKCTISVSDTQMVQKKKGDVVKRIMIVLCVMFLFAGLVSALGCSGDTEEQDAAGGPEETVEKYFDAVEQGDFDTLISLLDPEDMQQAAEQEGMEVEEFEKQIKDNMTETFPGGIKIEGLEYEVAVEGDTAVATIISGTMKFESGGEMVTQDLTEVSESLNLVKKDGEWYIKLEF